MITSDTTPVALAALSDNSTFSIDANGNLVLGMTPRRIFGADVVVEWVARSWLCKRGSIQYAKGLGVDVRDLENASIDKPALSRWRQALIGQARKRPFVSDCLVAMAFADRTTTIDARLILVDGKAYPLMIDLLAASKVILTLATTS
ncbi:MAG TPA: hypothetical protein VLT47_10920 [Anaeromyxobacteraceae bacterium]|nr:hypothetical protein [Anaeromyxobacteraceae bacterium]